jgi:hypothetical protein
MGMESKRFWLRAERVCWVVCLGLVANWFAFGIITMSLGGEGWSGYAVDGHYFLRSHGHDTETSWAVWEYTRMHATFSFVTLPLVPITALVAGLLGEHRNGNLILRPPSPPPKG